MAGGLQEPNPSFPVGTNGSVFTNSECTVTSCHVTTTANNKKQPVRLLRVTEKNTAGKQERESIF